MRICDATRRGVITAISGLAADLKAGVRVSRQNPGMALLVMGTLGLGLAVNTTVFSWVDSVLLRPIPGAAEPRQIAVLEEVPTTGQTQSCAYPDFRDYQAQADLFSGLAAWRLQAFMVGEGAGARRVYGQVVSANFFAVLGVKPIAGRVFAYDEDQDKQAGYPLAVISHRFWKARFGGDRKALGMAIRVNGHPLTIVGVAPPEFVGSVPGFTLDIWVHLKHDPRDGRGIRLAGRQPEREAIAVDRAAKTRRSRGRGERAGRDNSPAHCGVAPGHASGYRREGGLALGIPGRSAGRAAGPAADPFGGLLPGLADCLCQTWRICSWRAPSRGSGNMRCAWQSVQDRGGSSVK